MQSTQLLTNTNALNKKLIIGIIGASGKIGSEILRTLWSKPKKFPNIDSIIALNTVPRVNFGSFLDYSVAFPEKVFGKAKHTAVKTVLTSEPSNLKNADVIFITAGLWPTEATRQEWAKKDNTGRLVQSCVNLPLIEKICSDIKNFAPNAIVYVVTNQVDMMTGVARNLLPGQQVIGIGGYLDSARYKFVLANLLFEKNYIDSPDPGRIEAHLIGFHNNSMMLLKSSLKIDGNFPDWQDAKFVSITEEALNLTKSLGKKISDLKKHPKHPDIDSGSSILPAKAVIDVMHSICTDTPLTASFNVRVNEEAAKFYGIAINSSLSIPIIIQGLSIKPLLSESLIVSETEQEALRTAQSNLTTDIESLLLLQTDQQRIDEFNKDKATITVNSNEPLRLTYQ